VLQSPAAVTVKDWVEGVRKKITSRGPFNIKYDMDTLTAVTPLASNMVVVSSIICGDYAVSLVRTPNASNYDYNIYYCNLTTGVITVLLILSNVSSFTTPYLYPVYGSTDSFTCMNGTSGYYVVTTYRTKSSTSFSTSFGYPYNAFKYGSSYATFTCTASSIYALGRSSTYANITATGAKLFHSDNDGVYALVSNSTSFGSASWSVSKYHATSTDGGNTVTAVVCDSVYAITPPAGWTYMGANLPVVKDGYAYILFTMAPTTTTSSSTVAVCKMNLSTGAYTFSAQVNAINSNSLAGFGASDKYAFFSYYGTTGVTVFVSLDTGEVYKVIQRPYANDSTAWSYFQCALARIQWVDGIPYDNTVLVGDDFKTVIAVIDDLSAVFSELYLRGIATNYGVTLGDSGGTGYPYGLPVNIRSGVDDPLKRYYSVNVRNDNSYTFKGSSCSFIAPFGGSTHVIKQAPCSRAVSLESV